MGLQVGHRKTPNRGDAGHHASKAVRGALLTMLLFLGTLLSPAAASTVTQEAKLVANDAAAGDTAGRWLAIDGDTLVVGAPQDDHPGKADAGSVYVFVRNGTTWTEQVRLTASDAAAGDSFGSAVSVDGDTAVVGAYLDDHAGGANAGSAYVFVRNGTAWTQQARLTAGDAAGADNFGYSVSLQGDVLAVGSYRDDDGSKTDAGSAYVFVRNGTAWSQQARLTADDAAAGDTFGHEVALDGTTLLVGAHNDDDNGTNSGSAYVFTFGASWTQEQKLTADDAAGGDLFGYSVALEGDTLVVGARDADVGGTIGREGGAYVFARNGTLWEQQQNLTAGDGAAGDWFGYPVSLSGGTLVAGAPNDDDDGADSGATYVFTHNGTAWTLRDKISAHDAAAGDHFGFAASIRQDTVAVGAYTDDAGASDTGSAYVFRLRPDEPPKTLQAPAGNDGFDPATEYEAESLTGHTPFGGALLKPTWPGDAAVPCVSLAKGEFVASFPLLVIRNDRGSDFRFDLTYRSIGNADGNASLAWGWDGNWLQHLEPDGTGFLLHAGDGRTLRFTPAAGGTYDGPPGSYSQLAPIGPDLELHDRNGGRRAFDAAHGHRLREVHDMAGNRWQLQYNPDGTLMRIIDAHDRAITFQYLTGAAVTGNPFYQQNGRPLLVAVTDFAGRSAAVTYDHATGRLASVKTPGADAGTYAKTRFTYDADGRVAAIHDHEGRKYLKIAYDGHGRVVNQQAFPDAGPALQHAFAYNHDDGLTLESDPNDNVVQWRFDHGGTLRVVPASQTVLTRGLRPPELNDPTQYVTTYAFNGDGELTRATFPRGNGVRYEYDETNPSFLSRGNLLREALDPGPLRALRDDGRFQDEIVTEYAYNTTFNVVTHVTEPRGTDGDYVPQNGGTQSAARYTTRIFYDFEESVLGDLNGDNNTTMQDRRPVKIEHPVVNPPASTPHAAFSPAYLNQAPVEFLTWNAAGQLTKHVDPEGNVERRTYHPSNGVSLDPGDREGYLQSVVVDDGGLNLTSTYGYTTFGEVTQTTDPGGHVRTYVVDNRGRVTQETGPAPTSYRTRWTYEGNDFLVRAERETDAGSNQFAWREFRYDDLGRLVEERVDARRPAPIPAALAGQPAPPTDHHAILYEHDANGNLVKRTTGAGDVEEWTYDERDLLLFQSVGPGNGTYAYDDNGNLLAHQDRRGEVTWHQRDGYDRPAARIDAHGTVYLTFYDPAGNVVEASAHAQAGSIRPTGRPGPGDFERIDSSALLEMSVRAFHYDEANQRHRMDERHFFYEPGHTKASSAATLTPNDDWVTTLQEYDRGGRATRTINDNQHATARTYDAALRLASVEDPIGNRVEYGYDADGNLVRTTETEVDGNGANPQTYVTNRTYDSEDRLVQTENPDHTTQARTYDGRGNVRRVTDELGNVVERFYDHADRPWLTRHEVRDGGTGAGPLLGYVNTTTHWDGDDRVLHRCDDNGHCTTYVYATAADLLVSETHPDLPFIRHAYDAGGNRVRTTYGNGRDITITYDPLGRPVQVDVVRDADTVGTTRQTFAYDALGRRTRTSDDGVTQAGALSLPWASLSTRSYDSLGRVVRETQNGLPVGHVRDGVGNVVSTMYPNGRFVERDYDDAERLDHVWDLKGSIADHAYQGPRLVERQSGGPSPPASPAPVMATTVGYDDMRRPDSLQHQRGSTLLAGLDVRHDAAGHRVAQRLSPDADAVHGQLLDLDSLYRSKSWKRGAIDGALAAVTGVVQERNWTLDGANNWVAWDNGGAACTRAYTDGNQLVSETCGGATEWFHYDANGNLARDRDHVYHWDFLNRLAFVERNATGGPEPLAAFGYDAEGRRVTKVFADQVAPGLGGPVVTARSESVFTYSGANLVQESQPVQWSADLGGLAPGVKVIRQFTYGTGIDEVLEMSVDATGDGLTTGPGDTRYFYHHDTLGSVVGLTNDAGSLVEGYAYDPYGGTRVRVPGPGNTDVRWDGNDTVLASTRSPAGNPFLYTSQRWDPETQTYHYRARQYDPGLGVFLSRDPIGVWSDSPNLGNPYAYVGNRPWEFTDPSGTCGAARNLWIGGCVVEIAEGTVAFGNEVWDASGNCIDAGASGCWQNFRRGAGMVGDSYAATWECLSWGDDEAACLAMCETTAFNLAGGLACGYEACKTGGRAAWDCGVSTGLDIAISAAGTVYGGGGTGSALSKSLRHAPDAPSPRGRHAPDAPPRSFLADESAELLPRRGAGVGGGAKLQSPGGVEFIDDAGSGLIRTPSGRTFDVPDGWNVRVADNSRGLIAQAPGSTGPANSLRVMDDGYFRMGNQHGQYIDPGTGRSGPRGATHPAWDYQGPLPRWYG